MATSMDVDEPEVLWLDTVEGEIAFFRSLTRARPVGIHKHFHVLTMRNAILRDTGKLVEMDDLWKKLRACYDLDNLENIVREPLVSSLCSGPSLSPLILSVLLSCAHLLVVSVTRFPRIERYGGMHAMCRKQTATTSPVKAMQAPRPSSNPPPPHPRITSSITLSFVASTCSRKTRRLTSLCARAVCAHPLRFPHPLRRHRRRQQSPDGVGARARANSRSWQGLLAETATAAR